MPMIGGGNKSLFFTGSEVAGTIGSTAVFSMQKKIKTDISRLSFAIDQNEMNPALTTFLETHAPDTGGATDDSGEYEDGTKFSSLTVNSPALVHINVGGVDYSGATPQRYYSVQVIKLSRESGSFSQESGKYAKPLVQGDVQKLQAEMTIPASYFPTSYYSNATDVVISVGKGFAQGWFNNAS